MCQIWDIWCFIHLKSCLFLWSTQNIHWLPAPFPQQRSYHEITVPLLQSKHSKESTHVKAARKYTVNSSQSKVPFARPSSGPKKLLSLEVTAKDTTRTWAYGYDCGDSYNAFSLEIFKIPLFLFGVSQHCFRWQRITSVAWFFVSYLLKERRK